MVYLTTKKHTKMAPLESRIVKKIKTALEARGAFSIKIHGSPLQVSGLPDILCCYRGIFIAFEVKRYANEQPTPLQRFQIGRIVMAGGVAITTHTVAAALEQLDWIDQRLGGRGTGDLNSPPS